MESRPNLGTQTSLKKSNVNIGYNHLNHPGKQARLAACGTKSSSLVLCKQPPPPYNLSKII